MKPELKKLLQDFLPDAKALEQRLPQEGSRATLYVFAAMIVVALLWATFSDVDRMVQGRGRFVTPLPNIVVQPLEPGVLKSLSVRTGQVVKKGEVLATLDPTFTTADSEQLGIRSDTLSARTKRLELELGDKPMSPAKAKSQRERQEAEVLAERRASYEAKLRQMDETIARLKASAETNRNEQKTLAARVKALTELEEMYKKLEADKFGSRATLLSVTERKLEVERDSTIARHREAEIAREIAASEAERAAYVRSSRQKVQEELSEMRQQRDEAGQQLLKAQRREQLVSLVSPEDAVVLEIAKKSVGSVLKDGEPMFVLVPLNAPLEVEVEISPTDVGELRVGDDVRVKVDTFPFQKHGVLDGKLRFVGADALVRQGQGGESYYYLARVALLPDTQLKKLPASARLFPGMTVSAELIVGKRSVISYFLYPVIRILDESIRER